MYATKEFLELEFFVKSAINGCRRQSICSYHKPIVYEEIKDINDLIGHKEVEHDSGKATA